MFYSLAYLVPSHSDNTHIELIWWVWRIVADWELLGGNLIMKHYLLFSFLVAENCLSAVYHGRRLRRTCSVTSRATATWSTAWWWRTASRDAPGASALSPLRSPRWSTWCCRMDRTSLMAGKNLKLVCVISGLNSSVVGITVNILHVLCAWR